MSESDRRDSVGQSADLRTRIAALLTEARIVSESRVMDDGYVSVFIRSDAEAAEVAADAVIRQLGLQVIDSIETHPFLLLIGVSLK